MNGKATRRSIVAFLLATHVGLLGWSAHRHSPTVDEVGHLAAGVSYWHSGTFRLYRVNPPLVRLVAALPVVLTRPQTDWSALRHEPGARPEWEVGEDFVAANRDRAFRLFTLARWACIPFSLLGAYVCYRWGSELYGANSGLLALSLWCFSPNVLGNAGLITSDAPAAAAGVLAAYLFWRWLRAPAWDRGLLAGLGLGAAQLVKFTWVLLFGLWPALWLIWIWSARRRLEAAGGKPRFSQLALILGLGVYTIHLGYGFEGSFRRLGSYEFISQTFTGEPGYPSGAAKAGNRFAGTWLAKVPVPVPEHYLLGIDEQKRDFEVGKPSYLRGEWRDTGRWDFYAYALLVKVPLGTWLLGLLAVFAALQRKRQDASWKDELAVWAPAAAVFALASSQTGLTVYFRYVLPAFGCGFVGISRVGRFFSRRDYPACSLLAGLALAWSVGSSLWVYPHSLSYFNELAGGPENGHAHLVNSNIDWGQDLFYLKEWLERRPDVHLDGVAFYGAIRPADLGIPCTLPPADPQPGWYAISVNCMYRHAFVPCHPADRTALLDFSYFLRFEPADRVGYSIYVYHITGEEANRARRELELPELAGESNLQSRGR